MIRKGVRNRLPDKRLKLEAADQRPPAHAKDLLELEARQEEGRWCDGKSERSSGFGPKLPPAVPGSFVNHLRAPQSGSHPTAS